MVLLGLSPDDYDCSNENANYLIENGEILGTSADGAPPAATGRFSFRMIRKWLSWNSEFYVLMRNFFYYNDLVARLTLRENPGGVEDNFQLQLYRTSRRENIEEVYSKAFSYLRELRKETAADGVPLALISIPLKMEIVSEQYRQVLATNGLKDGQLDLNQPLKAIAAFCNSDDIPLLDPRPALRQRQVESPCYFLLDGHWNVEGVRAASVSLARQMRDMGLGPWAAPRLKAARWSAGGDE